MGKMVEIGLEEIPCGKKTTPGKNPYELMIARINAFLISI